jgi:hypothetical protein
VLDLFPGVAYTFVACVWAVTARRWIRSRPSQPLLPGKEFFLRASGKVRSGTVHPLLLLLLLF